MGQMTINHQFFRFFRQTLIATWPASPYHNGRDDFKMTICSARHWFCSPCLQHGVCRVPEEPTPGPPPSCWLTHPVDPTCVALDDASAPRKAGSDAQVMKKVGGARFFGFSDGSCAVVFWESC